MISLLGRQAFVCGSTKGIGRAAAEALAEAGASVVLLARNETALKELCHELPAGQGQQHGYLVVDFSDSGALKKAVGRWVKSNSPVNILVNNTGGPPPGPASEANEDDFRAAFEQHLICNHILAQALIPGMKSEKYGRIINVISTSVKEPIAGLGVSNTVRGAVASWAKTLAGELGPFGITVNNVLPGAVDTDRLRSLMEGKADSTGKSYDDIRAEAVARIPLRRIAQPSELGQVIAFLASSAAGYITGVSLPVDGGRTAAL